MQIIQVQAGDFLEKRGKDERAKEAYRRGHAYRRAIELARRVFPSEVVSLEEEWGSWLVSQNQARRNLLSYINYPLSTVTFINRDSASQL